MRSTLLPLALASCVAGHTWIEQLSTIHDGKFGQNGYPRGYVARTDPGFTGDSNNYLLPPLTSGRTKIDKTDLLCHPSQRTQTQTDNYPRLKAAPGDYVALKYLENGHVTLPGNQLGKPELGGTVFVFGTPDPKSDERLADVLNWSPDGSGGDKRGVLLAAQNYDDGRCYQLNGSPMATARAARYPNHYPDQPDSQAEQWCETDLQVPQDAATGKPYTVYWVWQWPTLPNLDPGLPDGKDEYYTTCSDLDIIDSAALTASNKAEAPVPLTQQDPQCEAVPAYKDRLALMLNPDNQQYQPYASGAPTPTDGKHLKEGSGSGGGSDPTPTPLPPPPSSATAPPPMPTTTPPPPPPPETEMQTIIVTTVLTLTVPMPTPQAALLQPRRRRHRARRE